MSAAEIAERYRDHILNGMGRYRLREEAGCSEAAAREAIAIARSTAPPDSLPPSTTSATYAAQYAIPASPVDYADKWLELEGDFALLSDIHVPYYDADLIGRWIGEAERREIKRAVLIGDTMDGGQFHPKRGGIQHKRRWQDDIETAKELFRSMLKWFDEIIVLNGNHDVWFQAHMRGQADPEWLMGHLFNEFEGKIRWSEFEQASCKSGDNEFRLLHGANYSGPNPLGVGQRYAAKFECGVILGHQHHHCAGWSHSGLHQVVCMGGAHDPKRLDYVHRSPRTNPAQTQGFAMLQGGRVRDYPGGWL